MRLEKIKLAGFKSFAEPTTVIFPERLIAIVGPNGCGKSNLIDAVRFVIGESSARSLRGSAMPDVIFNGSATRKPASLASVELIFSNDEGRLGGEYANLSHIALKREISRDGESRYFLNGTRCRRRDVLDVLLGTGLGPRAYAIIEQGMISHLVEAKPEELRLFVEEAAGISKYKERRHETELKLEHVRANLQRACDIRNEIRQQVERLAKQARKAEKYHALGQAIQQCQKELIAIRWRQAEREHRRCQARVNELANALAAEQAALSQAEQATANTRAETQRLTQQLHAQQSQLYELNAAISRCDQSLRHAQKTLEERERSLKAWRSELTRCQEVSAEIRAQLASVEQERERLEQEQLLCLDQLKQAQAKRQAAELHWQRLQRQFDHNREAYGRHLAQTELLKAEIGHLEHQLEQTRLRHAQLTQERHQLVQALNALDLAALKQQTVQAQECLKLKLEAVAAAAQSVQQLADQKREIEQQLKELEAEHSRLQGQFSALETLQHHALGKDRSRLNAWFDAQGLKDTPRLAEVLEVETGWETAVESALSEWLEAVLVSELSWLPQAAAELDENVALLELHPGTPQAQGDALTTKLRTPWDLSPWLAGFRCIETLSAALARRRELLEHECWITPCGDQIGPTWVKLKRLKEPHLGILERQKNLQELRLKLEVLAQRRRQQQDQLNELAARLREAEQNLKILQAEERDSHTLSARLAAELNAVQLRQAEMRERIERLDQEILQISAQRQALEAKLNGSVQELAHQTEFVASQRQALEQLQGECEQARADFERIAAEIQHHRDLNTQLQAALERVAHTRQLLEQQLKRSESQERQLSERLRRTEAEQAEGKAPLEQARQELETLLARRAVLENDLAGTRAALKQSEAELRDRTGLWRRLEEACDQARSALEQARLAAEAARVRWQIAAAEAEAVELPKILQSLPEVADPQDWQNRLEQLKAQQESLKDVNLAAIEEHRLHSERLRFLDKQCADLEASLEMLAKAIDQIDRESRACFRKTFETIDSYFRERFPLLFGGGEAWLELSGSENPLDAGVRIVARPPGKRNNSIHLLSGGEKALTAIALVFSFFELNPAPVCFLDEVDASLDETNVARFCQLLKSMSERVQFIFVTHNKITMEVAAQLIGVTMREPGVSRIVAVDLKQAAEMAAA